MGARQLFTTWLINPKPLFQLVMTSALVKPNPLVIFYPKSLIKGKHSLQEQEREIGNIFTMKAQNIKSLNSVY